MEAKHTPENKLFNYLCEIGPPLIDTEVHEIRLIVYEELGLKDLTPEQIEELKVWLKAESTTLMFDYVAKNRLLEAENVKLNSKIEEYKTMESLHKSSSHQIRMLMDENLNLQSENIKLRNCGNCKHEHHPFVESTPCLGCCIGETDGFLNWEGK